MPHDPHLETGAAEAQREIEQYNLDARFQPIGPCYFTSPPPAGKPTATPSTDGQSVNGPDAMPVGGG